MTKKKKGKYEGHVPLFRPLSHLVPPTLMNVFPSEIIHSTGEHICTFFLSSCLPSSAQAACARKPASPPTNNKSKKKKKDIEKDDGVENA
jgi:hypothetical protein